MRPFEYANPAKLDEVIELIGSHNVRPLAGGTDLLTLMKADIVAPDQLINLKHTELPRGVQSASDGLTLGALATLHELEIDAHVLAHATALAEAASAAATPQLRNMATLGGNLLQRPRCWYFRDAAFNCWLKGGSECQARDGQNQHHAIFDVSPCVAAHPSDLASALVALDATVLLRGKSGERTLPLGEFFAAPTDARRTENVLQADELILSIHVPAQQGRRSTYLKAMDRKAWSFALVGVAAALTLNSDGTISDARIVLGGVAPIPLRAVAAEHALIGATPGDTTWQRAADAALADAAPLEHNGYKLPLAKALVRQALAALTAQ